MKKLFILVCFSLLSFASFAVVLRVDKNVAGGANNGTSWANAYNNLTTALSAAASGDQIWVADGTYIPGANATDFFLIPSGVSVYGGFAGGESTLGARNVATNITILSGNSVCNHVVGLNNVTAATVVDGFTITGASGGNIGGGIYNLGGGTNVTIANCIIKQNSASQGAGMCNDGTSSPSNPTLTNCTFTLNTGSYQGGGVFNYGPSGNVGGTYTNCIFDAAGEGQGNALFNYVKNGTSTMSFSNCEFKNNSSGSYYYAFDSNGEEGTTQLSFTSCTFTNNAGGAIFNNTYNSANNNTLTITNCTFTQNGGTGNDYPYGGAVCNYAQRGKCTSTVSGSTFTKNGGRAFYNDGSNSGQSNGTFTNCNFIENYGSGLYNFGQNGKSNQTVTGCSFSKNGSPGNSNAALYNHGDNGEAISTVSNCTFTENKAVSIYNFRNFKGSARPTFTNCIFSKNTYTSYSGTAAVYNNGNGDYCPAFTDCQFLDNVSSESGSAVYNFFDYSSSAKNNTTFLRCTFTGNSTSGSYGGGAVYNNFSGIVSVSFTDCNMTGNKATNSGSSGGAMVNFVNPSATGTLTVTNCHFDENEAGTGGGGVFNNGAGINMTFTNSTFNKNKLTNTFSSGPGGGGIYNFGSSGNGVTTYTDCQINENQSNAFGGGVVNNTFSTYNVQYLRCTINNNKIIGSGSYGNFGGGMCNMGMGDYPLVTDCSINGNIATYLESNVTKYADGGGIYNNNSYPTFTNCTINNNKGRNGGGFHNISGNNGGKEVKLINCSIRGNEAIGNGPSSDINGGDGGGIQNQNSNMTLLNCLITGNKASDEGGGVVSAYSGSNYTKLINCTVTGNKATFAGGIFYNTTPTMLKNTIVWGNSTQLEGFHNENLTFNNSLIEGQNPTGTANLDGTLPTNNPLFISQQNFSSAPTSLGDYRVFSCSPVINAGDNAANTTATDLFGNNRKFGQIDLGVYELPSTATVTPTVSTVQPTTCGGNGSITLSGFLTNTTFSVTYKKNNVAVGAANFTSNGSGAILMDNLTAGSYTDLVVTYGPCVVSSGVTATLSDPPAPSVTLGNSPIVCGGTTTANLPLTGTTGSPNQYSIDYNSAAEAAGFVDVTNANLSSSTITLTVPAGATAAVYNATLTVRSSTTGCAGTSQNITITVNAKPTVTLSVNGQTFNEGNTPTLCDTDSNPTNALLSNVTTACVAGSLVWRTQIGVGAWSDWSTTAPNSQPSNNTVYRYQAACDPSCVASYTNPIALTVNYRAATPQNVSLVADGTTVAEGESKTICNAEGNTIAFNATCSAGEILLYSVDGSDYSSIVPSQTVDNAFHNYRVRCRKADNTPSCVETESAVMSLKITTAPLTPTASITPTNGCGTPTAFSGNSSCGALTTIWYNAATNQALPNLPTTTPNATTSYYARCRNEAGCEGSASNTVTFTITPVNEAPVITVNSELVCTGTPVTLSANCPAGTTALWNGTINENPLTVAFTSVTRQTYSARCISTNGCQSPVSAPKTILWKAFELTLINVGQSQSATKPANDRSLWTSQFITPDAGPSLENSTEGNPTLYYTENPNKGGPRYWTIQVETCALGTDGSLTYDMRATPEVGVVRSYNTHENNAPYFMYANRAGFTELYAQNHPLYGFFADNGSGGNVYDEGLPKGLYKLGIRYWDQKGQGSIYPSTRQPAGNVLAYQEYWFRIQSKNGIGTGATRMAADIDPFGMTNGFARIMPNPVSNTLHLKVNEAKGKSVTVNLLDASGRTLQQRAFVPETDQHQEELEVSQLTNGMYFLQVNTAEKQATLKVVKVSN